MIKHEEAIEHKLLNLVHAVLLFLGIILLLGIVAFILFGPLAFYIVVVILFFLVFLAPRISPHLVLRMYRGVPLSYDEAVRLYDIVEGLSDRAGLGTVPRLYYIPSNMMNAFAVGSRDDAAIGITDGMLRRLDLRELTGIVAHEISHIRHNDMKVMGTADMISRLTSLFSTTGQVLLVINLPLILFGYASISFIAIFLLIAAPMVSGLLQLALSRTREFDADIEAARLTDDPRGLAEALKKVEYYSGGAFRKLLMPGYRVPGPSLFRTHPHTKERVERLMEIEERRGTASYDLSALDEGIFSFPSKYSKVDRKPRWRIGGLWY